MKRYVLVPMIALFSLTTAWADLSPESDVLTAYDPTGALYAQVGLRADGTVFGLNYGVFTSRSGPSFNIYYLDNVGPGGNSFSPNPGGLVFINNPDGTLRDTIFSFCIDLRCDDTPLYGFSLGGTDAQFVPDAQLPAGELVDLTPYLPIEPPGFRITFESSSAETPEPDMKSVLMGLVAVILAISIRRKRLRSTAERRVPERSNAG